MDIKLTGMLLLLGALFAPVVAHADEQADTPGVYLDDTAITTKVKAAFAGDKWINGRNISVRTDHGVVNLSGVVINKDEADRATALVAQIKSVKAVHNNLTFMPH